MALPPETWPGAVKVVTFILIVFGGGTAAVLCLLGALPWQNRRVTEVRHVTEAPGDEDGDD